MILLDHQTINLIKKNCLMNETLRLELVKMFKHDSETRQRLVDTGELFSGDHDYHPEMKAIHLKNNKRLKAIIRKHGWPGYSLVGKDGCESSWLIVQHAVLDLDLQKQAVELLKKAVEEHEADEKMLALLQDRVLMQLGEPQIYGTQHVVDPTTDRLVPYKIADSNIVEALRREIGLPPLIEKTTELNQERQQSRK